MKLVWVILVLAAVAVVGCQSSSPVVEQASAPVFANVPVPAPPGFEPDHLEPRQGEALGRAGLELTSFIETLPTPDYLQTDNAAAQVEQTERADPREPPTAAQRAFVAGRQHWLNGHNFKAISQLETAYRLAPHQAQIPRLLGRIAFETNRVQATNYLQKAVRLDPTDVDSLYLLGELAIQQNRWHDAVVTLAMALNAQADRRDVDPAIKPLAHLHLATALARSGIDRACIEHYRQYLQTPSRLARSTRFARKLLLRWRHRAATAQLIGDAYHRLNQPVEALQAYRDAADMNLSDHSGLVARLAYTYLRLGQPQTAQELVVSLLQQTRADPASVQLLRYLTENGVDRHAMAEQLLDIYQQSEQSADVAISIASLLDGEQGRQLLRDHLSQRPADSAVFAALMQQYFADPGTPGSPGDPGDPESTEHAQAIAATAATITALPGAADRYVRALFSAAGNAQTLLDAWQHIEPADRTTPAMRLIHGLILRGNQQNDQARAELELALEANPELQSARLALAELHYENREYEQATRLLEPLAESNSTRVVRLRAQLLAQTGQIDDALELLDSHIATRPGSLDLVILKARLQAAQGDLLAAQRTLATQLDAFPKVEPLYDELYNLLQHNMSNRDRQLQKLRDRINESLPRSWLARLMNLTAAIGQPRDPQDLDEVGKGLDELMTERPKDYRALNAMLELLWQTKRHDEANKLIDGRIDADQTDLPLLHVAQRHYLGRVGDRRRGLELRQLELLTQPVSEKRDFLLSYIYLRLDQPQKVVELMVNHLDDAPDEPVAVVSYLRYAFLALKEIEQAEQRINAAIERFADHRPDLMLQLAMLYQDVGRDEQAEKVMLDSLEDHPDHAGTNNALGYTWADQGVQLDRAEQMIRKAMEREPDSAAIRDSLGWLLYKQGRFAEAVRELMIATTEQQGEEPVILDHLGDAHYRLGQRDEARRAWQRAEQLYDPDEARFNSELRGLDQHLRKKLDAVQNDREPGVADIAPPPADASPPGPST